MPFDYEDYIREDLIFEKGDVKVTQRWGSWHLTFRTQEHLATKHSTTGNPEIWAKKKALQRINTALAEIENYQQMVELARSKLATWELIAEELGMEVEYEQE